MPDQILKVHDTLHVRVRLQKRNDAGVWVPAYTSPTGLTGKILVRNAANQLVINQPVTVIQADASDCIVEYLSTTPADTATAGDYKAEVEMTQGGEVRTWPSDREIVIRVLPDLG